MPKRTEKEFKSTQKKGELPFFEHAPPQHQDAEKGVIGSILIHPVTCDEVATLLRPEDFYYDANKRLYKHLIDMYSTGRGIDLMLLNAELERSGELEEIGGEAYIAEIMGQVQVAAHAAYYAQIVRDKAILRDLIQASLEILQSAYDTTSEPRELVSRSEEKIFALADERSSNKVQPLRDVVMKTLDMLEAKVNGTTDGVATGFYDFDHITHGGFHPGELIILAARPAMGKTALALNIADHAAVVQKVPTLLISMEMTEIELALRLICARGKIESDDLRNNRLTKEERDRLMTATNELGNAPMFIDDTPGRTVTEIGAIARRVKRQENALGLVVIDYLTLIQPDSPTDPRQEQVAKIARRLKILARELSVPILCVAQLNRQTEASSTNRPRLSHLRESGAIEQDADVVMFVHREEYYHTPEEVEKEDLRGKADLILAKQRNGQTDDIKLLWIGSQTRFANPADVDAQNEYDEFSGFSGNQEF